MAKKRKPSPTVRIAFRMPEGSEYTYGILQLDRCYIKRLQELRHSFVVLYRAFPNQHLCRLTMRIGARFWFSDDLRLDHHLDEGAEAIEAIEERYECALLPGVCNPDLIGDFDDNFSVTLNLNHNDLLIEAVPSEGDGLYESPDIEWELIETAFALTARAAATEAVESPARPERRVIELQEDP